RSASTTSGMFAFDDEGTLLHYRRGVDEDGDNDDDDDDDARWTALEDAVRLPDAHDDAALAIDPDGQIVAFGGFDRERNVPSTETWLGAIDDRELSRVVDPKMPRLASYDTVCR